MSICLHPAQIGQLWGVVYEGPEHASFGSLFGLGLVDGMVWFVGIEPKEVFKVLHRHPVSVGTEFYPPMSLGLHTIPFY